MKTVTALTLLCLFSLQSIAQVEPRPDTAQIKLECTTSTIYNENSGPFKKWGDANFNITVYKDKEVVYIKKQNGVLKPHWWGGNLPPTSLSPIVGNNNKAGIDSEKIWGESVLSHINSSSKLLINRLNGHIRIDFNSFDDGKDKFYIEEGSCRKVENLF